MGTIAEKISQMRRSCGFTQAEMARRLSMSRPAYAQIELGGRKVSAVELRRIADILHVNINCFFEQETLAVLEDPAAASRHLVGASQGTSESSSSIVVGYGKFGLFDVSDLRARPHEILDEADRIGSVTVVYGNKKYYLTPAMNQRSERSLTELCGILKGMYDGQEVNLDDLRHEALKDKYGLD